MDIFREDFDHGALQYKTCANVVFGSRFFLGEICGMKDFTLQRELRVKKLEEKLHEALVLPDQGEYLAKTGRFLRSNTLRTKSTRDAFKIILEAANDPCAYNDLDSEAGSSRFWTARVVADALKLLVKKHSLEVPQLPGFSWHGWIKEQTKLLHDLARRASRNSKAMDGDPTLQYPAEDWSSWA